MTAVHGKVSRNRAALRVRRLPRLEINLNISELLMTRPRRAITHRRDVKRQPTVSNRTALLLIWPDKARTGSESFGLDVSIRQPRDIWLSAIQRTTAPPFLSNPIEITNHPPTIANSRVLARPNDPRLFRSARRLAYPIVRQSIARF